MPSNKVGRLKAGQGLRRMRAQRIGNWRGPAAQANYEIGAELVPESQEPSQRPARASRWAGHTE